MNQFKRVTFILGIIPFFVLINTSFGAGIFNNNLDNSAEVISNDSKSVPGEVLVLTKASNLSNDELISSITDSSQVLINSVEKLHKNNIQKSDTIYGKRLLTLKFDEKIDPQIVADSVKNNSNVLIAEPNFLYYLTFSPNDTGFFGQWGLKNTGQFNGTSGADIDAVRAWDISTGTPSTVIAVIDTGIDSDHPDLVNKILPGWDVIPNDFIPEDDFGHGTQMAGVVGAETNNALGMAGTCPNCRILPIKANIAGSNVMDAYSVYLALEFAVNNPTSIQGIPANPYFADVISMSFGSFTPSSFIRQGIVDAYNAGAILVAGAGNNNNSSYFYPAAYNEVIAVGGTDVNDAKSSDSNYGSWVDVAAPGVSIYTTNFSTSTLYVWGSGTSFSSPFVAGTIGLMLSKSTTPIPAAEARQILIDTSEPVTGFPSITGGRINAYQALLANILPVMDPISSTSVEEGRLLTIDVNAQDGNGDSLTYSTNASSVLPSAFTFNSQTGVFRWRPTINDAGQYVVIFNVADGRGGYDSETITITVIDHPVYPIKFPVVNFEI